ncbi:MAG: HAD-IA family hydrolase [Burkholderiales bacterium]|nr:HAD-IA family hydrolase [Burkholderiales bacterium]MDE2566043.1 HAD-IA family hydrolase [Burkholderiales bacterium]
MLFDLDGTLVDSAPDLAAAANELRHRRALPPLPYGRLRPHAGSGARGMLGAAFALRPGDAGYEALRAEFLQCYEARMLVLTRPFEAARGLLDALDRHAVPWGIVTNKTLHLAQPLTQALGLLARTRALVGGDCTPHVKPHPAPLLEAARRLGFAPGACVYVGDDPRDIQAARSAGMGALAAAWGYLGPDLPVQDWGADAVLDHPGALLNWLELA